MERRPLSGAGQGGDVSGERPTVSLGLIPMLMYQQWAKIRCIDKQVNQLGHAVR